MLTQERLKKLLDYDPLTGIFTNKIGRGRIVAGTVAGTINLKGYNQIQIDGYIYRAARLAWLYTYGIWPTEVDHINGQRDCDKLHNLREVSRSQNNANSERPVGIAGLRGVTWFERDQKWKAQIRISGQSVHLGYFDTVEQAHVAYLNAVDVTFGEYARHNRPITRRI